MHLAILLSFFGIKKNYFSRSVYSYFYF